MIESQNHINVITLTQDPLPEDTCSVKYLATGYLTHAAEFRIDPIGRGLNISRSYGCAPGGFLAGILNEEPDQKSD